jgi:uncharacterized protein YhaN
VRFVRLRIAGFGRLSSTDIEFGDGLTVVAGPNEAGKSTIVECLLRMLFGYPKRQFAEDLSRYEPRGASKTYAAALEFALDDGRAFEVTRDFARAEVPTQTVEVLTRRPVADWSGNRTASPGDEIFGFSLDVYRAAAVVTAGDLADTLDERAARSLADKLAAAVGSAGDASAADAIERLQRFYREIGVSGPNTPMGKAASEAQRAEGELRRYAEDYERFKATLVQRAALEDTVRDVTARRARCAAALASARLRATRARITVAAVCREALAAATAARPASAVQSQVAIARRRDVDAAIETWRTSAQIEAEADARTLAREDERSARQRELDAANASLTERRAAAHRLDEAIATHEAAAAGRPAITADAIAQIDSMSDDADTAEARQRALETVAAIARQQGRPSPLLAALCFVLALALGAGWLFSHLVVLAVLAIGAAAVAVGFGAIAVSAGRKRTATIADKESAAATAGEHAKAAADLLSSACRRLGCTSAAAVRAARTAQVELDGLRGRREAAADAAAQLESKRDAVQSRFADLIALQAERVAAHARTVQALASLTAVLDETGMPPGSIDERLESYLLAIEAGTVTAAADVEVANARSALAAALGDATFESLEEEAARYAADAASGGDPGEFADRSENDLDRELGQLDEQLVDSKKLLHGANERISEFEQQHPIAVADLEERAAATDAHRKRLENARNAAKIAWEAIDAVKDGVHRDFTPKLNEAVQRSAAAITDGRYGRAWVDQNSFRIRVLAAENGATVDAETLSTGTIEQLQFSLRAAVAEALGRGERVPILYDDALAHADDQRLRSAIEHAARLAADGAQIVFFTQRGDVEQLAGSATGVRIVRLAGPPS